MTIDTKNLRVLAEAGKATGFDLVDMNEHDFAACQKAKRELRTAMTPTAVVELLDALERKDNCIRGCIGLFKESKYQNPLLIGSVIELLEEELGMSTKAPCGECHLKPNERCDICGAKELT